MDFMTIIIISAVIGFAVGIFQIIHTSNKKMQVASLIGKIPDFRATYEYLGADGNSGIAIDESQPKVCLLSRVGAELNHRIMDHKDILSSELFEDGETITKTVRSSQAVGAVVGGLLFGGVGAVIGGLSGGKVEKGKVKRIELRLVVNDSANPVHNICFFDNATKRDSVLYQTAFDVARQWQARLDVLIKRATNKTESEEMAVSVEQPNTAFTGKVSIGDELKKLADLRVQGILTDEEFVAQKAKLLG